MSPDPEFPRSLEELTPAWLSTILHSAVSSVSAEAIGVGVGFIGQLARITLSYDSDEAALPRSIIAKLSTADVATRQFVAMYGLYRAEINFYQEIATSLAVRTPRCYFAAISDDGSECLLVLEDLGASGVVGDQMSGCSVAQARLAVDHLAAFHATWWASPELESMEWLPTGQDQARALFVNTYPFGWQPCLERYGHLLPQSIIDAAPTLNDRALAKLDELSSSPMTISHGDFRLDNMFFGTPAGPYEFAVIDWQVVNRGVGTYDLAYFLVTNLDIESRRRSEVDLLNRYHRALIQHGVSGYSLSQCQRDYRAAALMLLVVEIAAAIKVDPANERGMALFEQIFRRVAAAAIDHDALSA